MPFNPSPITVKDGASADKPLIAYNDGTNSAFAHPVLDNNGAIISPATSDKQDTGNASLTAIAGGIGAAADAVASSDTGTFSLIAFIKRGLQNWTTLLTRVPALVGGRVPVDGSGVTQPVSATTLPLPTGAATSANQATGNTSVANLDTNLGARADSAATSDTGTFSAIAFLKRALQNWTLLLARIPALGAAASAASLPVVIASDQAALPLPTGAATAANQATQNGKLDSIIANTGAGSVNLTITPTVTAGAYTSGMVAGGKLSLANAVRTAGGSGIIQAVSVSKKTALSAPYDVYFFHTDPTSSSFTDNAALALNVADLPYLIGVARCTDFVDNGTPKTLQAQNLAIPFKLAAGTTLFAVAVIRGSETLASTSALVINVGILQD